MLWFVFAFFIALFESLKDVTMKHSLRDMPARVVAWAWIAFSLPFLGVALLFDLPVTVGAPFWPALLVGVGLNVVAISLYAKALKHSDLSTTIPMIAFSPLFLLVTSPLIVGEFPNAWGVLGVVLVTVGSYVLNIRERQHGYLAPFKALVRETGPRLMLGVAFIWGIAATVDKIGVQNSSPVLWVAASDVCIAALLTPFMLRSSGSVRRVRANWKVLLVIGMFSAAALICQMTAISLTLVAYVISVKRMSIMFGVIFGALIFKEQGLRERLAGVIIMQAGVVVILLF
jgi:drug/metabolite transporter (DMT)-like permease